MISISTACRVNRVLALVALGLVELRIGFWSVRNGKLHRTTSHYRWKLGTAAEAAMNGAGVTAADRFMMVRNARRRAKGEEAET